MRLRIMTPAKILVDEPVNKVKVEAVDGAFTLLPRHIDFLAALVPGLIYFEAEDGGHEYLAADAGILVKCDDLVRISTLNAVRGADLGHLQETVQKHFRLLDERERGARVAVARLESDFVRQYLQIDWRAGGHSP